MNDFLLETFFEKNRWQSAIETAIDKGISKSLLKDLADPFARLKIYRDIRDGRYTISPPHEAQIPKDDGSFRTVYVNEDIDRILLSIANDMFFELCPEMIHPNCRSYQKGIGCGKIVQQVSAFVSRLTDNDIGVKIDLSKYFDSVPIEYIDGAFDRIEQKHGKSALMDMIRRYYHNDTVLGMDRKPVDKYSSLRQGCAVAAFLADTVLYGIDKTISEKYNIYYVRYSDDILILGKDWEQAYAEFRSMLSEMGLSLNPKKIETLHKNKWFKFLGFTIKNSHISLSRSRIKSFQEEIDSRTIRSGSKNIRELIGSVQRYLYTGKDEYSWATGVLPVVNVKRDIDILNGYAMDAIRAGVTGKTRLGGLGLDIDDQDHTITRGAGRHVKENKRKIPVLPGFMTIACMKSALAVSKEAYTTLTATM